MGRCISLFIPKIITCLLLSGPLCSPGQEPLPTGGFDPVEQLGAENTDEEPGPELGEAFEQLLDNPVRINAGDVIELSRLFFMTHEQLDKLHDYLLQYGPMLSKYELAAVDGIDRRTAMQVANFIILDNRPHDPDGGKIRISPVLSLYGLLEEKSASGDHSADSLERQGLVLPCNLRFKFPVRLGNAFSMELRASQAAGDTILPSTLALKPGFVSGNIAYRGKKFLKELVVGDYQLAAGKGLLLWNAFSMPSSSRWLAEPRIPAGLQPAAKYAEGRFFRGASAILSARPFELLIFASNRNGKRAFGSQLLYKGEKVHIGLISVLYRCNDTSSAGKPAYALLDYRQSRDFLNGFHYRARLRNLSLSGEISCAATDPANPAWMIQQNWKVLPVLSLNMAVHKVPAGWNAEFSCARPNQSGIFTAVYLKASDALRLNLSYSFTRYMFIRYLVSAPSDKKETSLELSYDPGKAYTMDFTFRYKASTGNRTEDPDVINAVDPKENWSYAIQLIYDLSETWSLNSGLSGILTGGAGHGNSQGMLCRANLNYHPSVRRMNAAISFAMFDTDTWNERLYFYDYGPVKSGRVVSVSGNGIRTGFTLRTKLLSVFSLGVEFDRLIYFDRMSSGSGDNLVRGRHRTEWALSLMWDIRAKVND